MDILNNQLLSGGLILGAITTLLYSIKTLGQKLITKLKDVFIFRVVVYDYDELFYVLENYIANNYPGKYKNLEASYEQTRRWIKGIDDEENPSGNRKIRKVFWKQEPNIFTIKIKGKRFYISKDKKELEHAQDLRSLLNFHYSISAWRGKKAIQDFLNTITDSYNKEFANGKLTIYVSSSDEWRLSGKKKVKSLDEVVLKKETKSFLLNDMDEFMNSRDWYQCINVVYKRSYAFEGPPGTGKTTTAQAMASYMGKDICLLNLNSVASDAMLINLFSKIPDNSLLLIEDIDCVFKNRRPVSKDTKITFSCLLNCLDGTLSKDGIITVITTNHIEDLDPALLRAGRMDVTLTMPLASNEEIDEYLSLFYRKQLSMGDEPIQLNMSAVQEACLQNKHDYTNSIKTIINKSNESKPVLYTHTQ